jgi:hypothetical protein
MPDFIPPKDKEFDEFANQNADYTDSNFAALGLTTEQNDALQLLRTEWGKDYQAHLDAEAAAQAATQRKDTSRQNFEKKIRELTGIIQPNSAVTNEQRAALGITIPKDSHTPAPLPTSRPFAKINNVNRFVHILDICDENTPNSKAKPKGVHGCEVWYKIGDPAPTDESDLTFVDTATQHSFTIKFKGADAGKLVHYWLRWVNTTGKKGNWSETISITISG